MAKMTLLQSIRLALIQAMEVDETVLCIGQDIAQNGGVFRVTEGLLEQFGQMRIVDAPIAESAIVGTAVGLATRGLRPIAEIQFFGFIYQAMDQLASQAARLHTRSNGELTVPLVVRSPYGGGIQAPEMHSDSLEALFMHTPGLYIVVPSTPRDAKGLLAAAINNPNPVLFLEPMKLYRSLIEEVPVDYYEIPLGRANTVIEGQDLTIISYGAIMPTVLEVVKQASYSIEVLDLRTIAPLDLEAIYRSVNKTGRVIIVHEAVKTAGVGAEIAANIAENCLYALHAPIMRVTGQHSPYPVSTVEAYWLPNNESIMQAIETVMADEGGG
ncbi:alpha-ketoacid dehydrogenase subunit beta [Kurthia sibirica]|uniref:Alpha-ketoacid dehydrogenase subunit beta n=1 Tax=Kurthia sibirica TaxID=202750 RepID=A0A2U3AGI2_9BACL|nr:alpha-ketoacid dehydrogenase subunit beta [Kurthia sibirica]PWI23561.1 alpha-ketoacid dehydrogenase subunit beta [Kurthia sibirica]GEK35255.1 2-oxoisovalerate dehydrogenase subunit beta [Kurthia sibirica]